VLVVTEIVTPGDSKPVCGR